MLLQYAYADYSTDIWSLGSIFAALLYRKLIYFNSPVDTSTAQILLIAQVRNNFYCLLYRYITDWFVVGISILHMLS